MYYGLYQHVDPRLAILPLVRIQQELCQQHEPRNERMLALSVEFETLLLDENQQARQLDEHLLRRWNTSAIEYTNLLREYNRGLRQNTTDSSHPQMTATPDQPSFDDALKYVTQVKDTFSQQPDVYQKFLNFLVGYQSRASVLSDPKSNLLTRCSIDLPGVLDQVSNLFAGHPLLLQGLNQFIPPRYRTRGSATKTDNHVNVDAGREDEHATRAAGQKRTTTKVDSHQDEFSTRDVTAEKTILQDLNALHRDLLAQHKEDKKSFIEHTARLVLLEKEIRASASSHSRQFALLRKEVDGICSCSCKSSKTMVDQSTQTDQEFLQPAAWTVNHSPASLDHSHPPECVRDPDTQAATAVKSTLDPSPRDFPKDVSKDNGSLKETPFPGAHRTGRGDSITAKGTHWRRRAVQRINAMNQSGLRHLRQLAPHRIATAQSAA
jgi:hypothetical protein